MIWLNPNNRASIDYNPQPEWYFLFLFHLLHYATGRFEPLLIVLVPLLVIGRKDLGDRLGVLFPIENNANFQC